MSAGTAHARDCRVTKYILVAEPGQLGDLTMAIDAGVTDGRALLPMVACMADVGDKVIVKDRTWTHKVKIRVISGRFAGCVGETYSDHVECK